FTVARNAPGGPRIPPLPSATSSRSCCGKSPPCPSRCLGGRFGIAVEPGLGTAPEWAVRKPRLGGETSPQLSPPGGGRLVPQPTTRAGKLTASCAPELRTPNVQH